MQPLGLYGYDHPRQPCTPGIPDACRLTVALRHSMAPRLQHISPHVQKMLQLQVHIRARALQSRRFAQVAAYRSMTTGTSLIGGRVSPSNLSSPPAYSTVSSSTRGRRKLSRNAASSNVRTAYSTRALLALRALRSRPPVSSDSARSYLISQPRRTIRT